MTLVLRPAVAADLEFLGEMLVEAAYPPWVDPRPSPAHALAEPHGGRYLRGWGRPRDVAVIAESDGRPVGAAWYRRFPASETGYGFISEDLPEIAIAVVADRRGQGIGRGLLTALVEMARANGEPGLSLSVSPLNEVGLRLYGSVGFTRVAGADDDPTLAIAFPRPPRGPTTLRTSGA